MNAIVKLFPALSSENEKYLMNHIVIVIKETDFFGLAKVRYKDSIVEFYVDKALLYTTPDFSHTINLNLLGGVNHDSGLYSR